MKQAKNRNARVVVEICEESEEDDQPLAVALAVLSSTGVENANLNVILTARVGLRIAGKDAKGAIVHITGNELVLEEYESDDDDEIDIPPDLLNMDMLLGSDSEEDMELDDSEEPEQEIEIEETEGHQVARVKPKNPAQKENRKMVVKGRGGGLPVITHRSGLKLQDILIGSGKRVVRGHNVALQYVLRLENGKVIDKAERKRPFKFRLGIGECVKGFDIGVSGMREGGERHLIVPPDLGYGEHSPPGIPKNATLYFDVTVIKAF